MKNSFRQIITVFEHETIYASNKDGEEVLSTNKLLELQRFHKKDNFPFYSLVHNGIRFCEYVGVLQIGSTTIEVLPKTDKGRDKEAWRIVLINMLKAVGIFDIYGATTADLKLKANSILDLYFELFLIEVEHLIHKGLIKHYRRTEDNLATLKGSLYFSKHIRQNFVHEERFYVRYSTYDQQHPLNRVLYKTIKLIEEINSNPVLTSRIRRLLLHFPEMPDIKVNETFFEKISYNRKTEGYKTAISISRLLLLNHHPDVSRGRNNVLALMFDMNELWERFVYVSLRKYKPSNVKLTYQPSRDFWKPEFGSKRVMIADIVIKNDILKTCGVIDTKWKKPGGYNPSLDDLRQLYAYCKFHQAMKGALVYPGETDSYEKGFFYDEKPGNQFKEECSILTIKSEKNTKVWQQKIVNKIFEMFNYL